MPVIVVTEPGTTVAVGNGDTVKIEIPGGGDVTIVADGPNVRRFRIDFLDDTQADTVRIDLDTFSQDNLSIDVRDYDPSDEVQLLGEYSRIGAVPGNVDEFQFQFAGTGGDVKSGFIRLKDVGERDFTDTPRPIIICFTDGTVIDTELGPTPVEALTVGDLVRTVDRGLQPLAWVGHRVIAGAELAAAPHLWPVRIAAGAMGGGLPWTDLLVSPQHRIWLADWRAEVLFGESEVLVPAKALVGAPGIGIARVDRVSYRHILFDRHEMVWSNGLVSESLHPGEVAQSALGDAADEVRAIVGPGERALARPALRVGEARAASAYAA